MDTQKTIGEAAQEVDQNPNPMVLSYLKEIISAPDTYAPLPVEAIMWHKDIVLEEGRFHWDADQDYHVLTLTSGECLYFTRLGVRISPITTPAHSTSSIGHQIVHDVHELYGEA